MAAASHLHTSWAARALAGLLVLWLTNSTFQNAQPKALGPGYLRVSQNGHYFVKDGSPFFWLGDTTWSLVNQYTRDEAEFYLEHRRKQGFTVEHVMPLFDGGPGITTSSSNTAGEEPFLNMNPATPNDAYFKNLDHIVKVAQEKGLIVVILPCGGSGGSFVDKKKIVTKDNARAYGKWLGQRYKEVANIVWANGFDLKPWRYEEIAAEFAAGLQEGDGGSHLITYHPSGGASSSHFHHEDWLDANIIQTWADYLKIYPMTYSDYMRIPPKPVVMAEGAYEEGPEYPTKPITPLLVRKQAYWSYLAGGFHTYGHNDIWRKNPTWRQALDAPGARQMSVLKKVFTARQWWKLVPDQSVFASGASGEKTLNVAARSSDGDNVIIYLSSPATVSIRMNQISVGKSVRARWVNPETGAETVIGDFQNTGTRSFSTPQSQEDSILLLDAVQ
jgi:Protein of unknown function (DUF4038)/Putative collagen-binding domain of a collagenase